MCSDASMMALVFLGLSILLIQSPWALVGGSVQTYSWICGSDHVGFLESSDEFYLFVNQKRIDDRALICEALEFYFANGCFFCDSRFEEWGNIGKKYCDRDFGHPTAVDFLQRIGRKVLLEQSANSSIPDQLSRKGQPQDEKQDHRFSLAPDKMVLAMPGALLLCCALLCPCFYAKRKDASKHNVISTETNLMDSVSTFEVGSNPENIPATPLRVPPSPSRFSLSPQLTRTGSIHLSVNQIMKATHNFSPSLQLGEGGFGTVYKAVLPDGQVVAIKRAKKEYFPSLRDEFRNEVELLAKIEHRNLVRLLGYTDKGNERIIITEYVPNGTLREHLDGQHGKILDFNQRLEIAIDVAHALTYLHLYAEKTIIHRDVKSSNILLTESFRAKVSDFGFARTGPTEGDQTHILTKVKGTAGYLDPEYLKTFQLTPKSDVFSFGILLVEIISGRRPVELKRSIEERVTLRWAFTHYDKGDVREVLDPLLEEAVDVEVLAKIIGLAFQCAAPTRADRPAMKQVGEQLWEIRKDYVRSLRRL